MPAQDLICGLSDAHNGGRSVVCVITRTGSRVAYKPKPLELDGELIRLSKWIDTVAAGDDRLALFIPRVLAMGPYGWTEWIEPLPCESESEAKLSYARTGSLLCVLHHLYAIDVHRENLIAHGDRPYFIDSETLMQPMARGSAGSGIEETSASYRLEQLLADSVLRTGMVPAWVFSNSREQSLDESGLGGTGLEAFERVPVWRNINSDWMELEYVAPEEGGAVFSNNVVRIGGRALDSSAYVSEIVDGYRAMYDLILTNREIWKEDGGFLDTLSRQDVRFVFRPTQVYATILAHALTPNCLRSGEKRSMVLDRLAVGYLSFPEKPAVWDLLKSEIAALEQCDIPFFTVKVSETAL
ncbi:type 2 lantipeptide synthetase LanM, partial [bacterium]